MIFNTVLYIEFYAIQYKTAKKLKPKQRLVTDEYWYWQWRDPKYAAILTVTVWFVRVDFVSSEQRLQQKPRHLLYTGVLLTVPNMNSFNMKADF